jgi:hypothetical protein
LGKLNSDWCWFISYQVLQCTQCHILPEEAGKDGTIRLLGKFGGNWGWLGENVTLGALKNLVTDKPAPITVKLAQIEKDDKMKNLVTDK